MPADPRLVIRQLFDYGESSCAVTSSNLLKADSLTHARFEADYEYSELMLQRLFLDPAIDLDLIFIITLEREDPPSMAPSGPIASNFVVGVQPVTIMKYHGDGTVKVNGDTLGRAAVEEIKSVIRNNPLGSFRVVGTRTERVERVGGTLIYGDIVEVHYHQYVTGYLGGHV